ALDDLCRALACVAESGAVPTFGNAGREKWSRRELNPRPLECDAGDGGRRPATRAYKRREARAFRRGGGGRCRRSWSPECAENPQRPFELISHPNPRQWVGSFPRRIPMGASCSTTVACVRCSWWSSFPRALIRCVSAPASRGGCG